MNDAIQAQTLEMKVNQAMTDEQFNTIRAVINTVKAAIKALNDKVADLHSQQRSIDARLWSFIVVLILLLTGGLVKLTPAVS